MPCDIYYASAIQYITLGSIYYFKKQRPFQKKQALIVIFIGLNLIIFSSQSIFSNQMLSYILNFLYSFSTVSGTILIYTVCKESFEYSESKKRKNTQSDFNQELALIGCISLALSVALVYLWYNTEPKILPNLFSTLNGFSITFLILYCLYIQVYLKNHYARKALNLMYFLIALIAVEKLKLMIPNPYSSTITLVGGIIYIVLPIFLFSNLLIITPPKKEFESLPKSFEFKKATGIDLLVNLDNEKIMFKLYDLFVHERIFLDEDLRLPTLSEEMGLSVHQLSAFINRHLRTNFNTFVNYFRLKEAMSMLIEEPSRSILSICMAVGFNGMSTFQRFFLYATNTSPSKYREAVVNGEKIEFSPLFQPIAFEIHQFEEQYLRRCEHRAISELTM